MADKVKNVIADLRATILQPTPSSALMATILEFFRVRRRPLLGLCLDVR
eukprot:COSAG01_NODE_68790_length_263_cov_0.628049_1_plen_48_part_10